MERRIAVREDTKTDSLYITYSELEIVRAIAEGKTSKEIALDRNVSFRTVEVQRRNVLKRLACRNMPHLINTLFRQKILV
jgi:DNA-binding NarL/FixJ family response regulator